MKFYKVVGACFIFFSVLLAFFVDSYAIGFDAENTYKSVFIVESANSLGSGFASGKNSVITNAHVVGNENKVKLTTYDGNSFYASVYAKDDDKDIAILAVEKNDLIPLSFSDIEKINVGDDVYAIGAPKKFSFTLTKGVVSSKKRVVGNYSYIQTDAAINEGNSGGPLVDDGGNVIGMNSMKLSDSEGIGLAIPSKVIIDFIKESGIEIDSKGTVSEITQKAESSQSSQENRTFTEKNNSNKSGSNSTKISRIKVIIPWICFGISAVLNIIFIIILCFKKENGVERIPDSTERTDFEIDILD